MRISFLSGTRADYSKIKPYISFFLEKQKDKEIYLFVTGMHMLEKYGKTYKEIQKDFGKLCHIVLDKQFVEKNTSQESAHILSAYDKHLHSDQIDFVFVHGDRPEALAGAIAARLNNIPLCQIEAGDLSGSIDDSIRHAITKLSHRLLVSDTQAQRVLLRSGENKSDIFVVGNSSLANTIPKMGNILKKYDIPFEQYAILIYHPVTTESVQKIQEEVQILMQKLKESKLNYVVILPNNDLNHQIILDEYRKYQDDKNFRFYSSFPFEVFTTFLKGAQFLIGNSSCGIKEAPYYGVPVIDIGLRQKNRYHQLKKHLFYHLDKLDELTIVIKKVSLQKGKSEWPFCRKKFFQKLTTVFSDSFWKLTIQKDFHSFIRNS